MRLVNLVLFSVLVSASLLIMQPAFAATKSATAVKNQSSFGRATSRLQTSWPWYVVRASGIVAVITLVLLMLSGMGLLTGHTYKFLEPIAAWATHRALGIAFAVSVLVHVFTLLFDHYVSFNIFQILIPFVSRYNTVKVGHYNLGSLWMAMGIIALYGAAAVMLTSLYWIDKKPRSWRLLHYISYAVVALVFFHTMFAGTDFMHGSLLRIVWIVIGIAMSAYGILRIWRAGTMRP